LLAALPFAAAMLAVAEFTAAGTDALLRAAATEVSE
jgi:hypothetical protein